VLVEADNAAAARGLVQADCEANRCHCPTEWCTDDIDSEVTDVKTVSLDGVTLLTPDGAGPGTL